MTEASFCYRTWLVNQIKEKQKKNPSYSLRSFARNIGLSPSHLSNLISAKRPLTTDMAEHLADRLNVTVEQRQQLLKAAINKPEKAAPKSKKALNYNMIKEQEFHIIDKWYHFGIMGLGSMPGARFNPEWVSKRLNITENEAEKALLGLKRYGFITTDTMGGFTTGPLPNLKSRQIKSGSMQKLNHQIMNLAKRSLEKDPIEDTLFSVRFHGIPAEKKPTVKAKIKELQDELISFIDKFDTKNEGKVFAVNIQFFPVDQGINSAR